MSRSYKKTPIVKDSNKGKKLEKRFANKKIRAFFKEHSDVSLPNNSYKKVSESWNIADFTCRWSKEDAIQFYNDRCRLEFYSNHYRTKEDCIKEAENFKKEYPTVEDFLQKRWSKDMRRK